MRAPRSVRACIKRIEVAGNSNRRNSEALKDSLNEVWRVSGDDQTPKIGFGHFYPASDRRRVVKPDR